MKFECSDIIAESGKALFSAGVDTGHVDINDFVIDMRDIPSVYKQLY